MPFYGALRDETSDSSCVSDGDTVNLFARFVRVKRMAQPLRLHPSYPRNELPGFDDPWKQRWISGLPLRLISL